MDREQYSTASDDEIDFIELFKALLRHKFLIIIITVMLSVLGFYNAFFVAVPKYQANAIFNIKSGKESSLNLQGLASIAALGGIGNFAPQKTTNILDQINGADFLREIIKKLNLQSDPEFFNPPIIVEETWFANKKATLKRFLGLKNDNRTLGEDEIVEATLNQLRKNFDVGETKNGSYKLTVKSTNASKAAFLANTLMNDFLKVREETNRFENERSLSYLQETLANSKRDLEKAVVKIEQFMLARNMLSEQEFISQSRRLKEFRDKISEIENQRIDLLQLQNFLEEATHESPKLNLNLKRLFDIAPQLRSSVRSQTKGDQSNLVVILETVRRLMPNEVERLNRALEATTAGYNKLAKRAKQSAIDARELAELSGDAEAKRLIFKALAQQVDTTQIADGFKETLGVVYETAIQPRHPFEPKKSQILILHIFIGLALGCTISLLINFFSKKIWSSKRLKSLEANCEITSLNVRLYKSRKFNSASAIEKTRRSSKIDSFKLNKLSFRFNNIENKKELENKFICIADFGKEVLAGTALFLARVLAESGKEILLLDISYKNVLSKTQLIKKVLSKSDTANRNNLFENVTYERLVPPLDSSSYNQFKTNLDKLKRDSIKKYDHVITIVDNVETENVSMTEILNCNNLLFLTKAGQLSKQNILTMKSLINERLEAMSSVPLVSLIFFNK